MNMPPLLYKLGYNTSVCDTYILYLGSRHFQDEIRAIELMGTYIFPPYSDKPKWKDDGDKIIIDNKFRMTKTYTLDSYHTCWPTFSGYHPTMTKEEFIEILRYLSLVS